MKKAMVVIMVIIFSLQLLFSSWVFDGVVKGAETTELKLASRYALIYNCDEDAILYEKNADQIMYPASLTKIMTVLVALEQENQLTKKVTIQAKALQGLAEADASVAGFKAGDQVRFIDLLYGAILPSGADATNMIAYDVAGSEAAFVKLMNEKAQSLHLKHTHFANASGLHSNDHYSSARDLLIILKEALKQETFYQIYTSTSYTSVDRRYHFESTASKMMASAGIDSQFLLGSKTGFTDEGGLCISFLTKVNNATYLVILGNAGNDLKTFQNVKDAYEVYQYLHYHYTLQTRYHAGERVSGAKIKYGFENEVDVCAHEDIQVLVKDGEAAEEIRLTQDPLNAPIAKDEQIATLVIGQGNLQHSYPLFAMKAVDRSWLLYLAYYWWIILPVLIALVYGGYHLYQKLFGTNKDTMGSDTDKIAMDRAK